MNHPSKNMASLAELVGADDEAAVLCAALAKAITRLERARDQADADALKLVTLTNQGHAARVEVMTGLQASVKQMTETTARMVKERDQVVRALRNLLNASSKMRGIGEDEADQTAVSNAEREARELLDIIDQTAAARGKKQSIDGAPVEPNPALPLVEAGDNAHQAAAEQPAGDQAEQPAGDDQAGGDRRGAGDQAEQPAG